MTTKVRPYEAGHTMPSCRVSRVTDYSVPTATGQAIPWVTLEYDAPGWPGMWDGVTAIYAPIAGVYHVESSGQWGLSNTGARYLYLCLNGGIKSIVSAGILANNFYEGRSLSCDTYMAKGDYMQLYAYQTSGASLAYAASAYLSSLSIRCVFANQFQEWGER